jgi:hypothetical protein
MFKITALFTTLALGATASIAMASPARIYDRRTGVEYTRGNAEYARGGVATTGGAADYARGPARRFDSVSPVRRVVDRVRIEAVDRGARSDGWRRGSAFDGDGPRRYRPTWVALGAPYRQGAGSECIEVHDAGTFTQLRLQSDAGFAAVGRVVVQFADGTDQVAGFDRELDQRGEFVELPLNGNNRRIAKIIVTGALGDLQVFAI